MSDDFQQRGGSPWGTPPKGGNGGPTGTLQNQAKLNRKWEK